MIAAATLSHHLSSFPISAGPERGFSARRKLAAVTRLLRGEPLETVARELNVTAARLSEWRDRALVAAEAAMKEHEGARARRTRRGVAPAEGQAKRRAIERADEVAA